MSGRRPTNLDLDLDPLAVAASSLQWERGADVKVRNMKIRNCQGPSPSGCCWRSNCNKQLLDAPFLQVMMS